MDGMLYDIIFSGNITSGMEIDQVKQKLASLYKKDVSKIEELFFQGKTIIVKRNVNYETALRLKSSLTDRTGAIFEIRENDSTSPPPIAVKKEISSKEDGQVLRTSLPTSSNEGNKECEKPNTEIDFSKDDKENLARHEVNSLTSKNTPLINPSDDIRQQKQVENKNTSSEENKMRHTITSIIAIMALVLSVMSLTLQLRPDIAYKIIPASIVPKSIQESNTSLTTTSTTPSRYQNRDDKGDKVVVDNDTGLMWQQAGSSQFKSYQKALGYAQELNQGRFGGFNNWRLPTKEELMSLIEPYEQSNGLYINPIFDDSGSLYWTSDKASSRRAWVISFYSGDADERLFDGDYCYVRCVRSIK